MNECTAILVDMDKVVISDATLRDGEQACGCSMTVAEKLKRAGLLADLGVGVLEPGQGPWSP
jgi:2-isopropylmalate synthase